MAAVRRGDQKRPVVQAEEPILDVRVESGLAGYQATAA